MYECQRHDTWPCYAYSKIIRTRTKYFTKHQNDVIKITISWILLAAL